MIRRSSSLVSLVAAAALVVTATPGAQAAVGAKDTPSQADIVKAFPELADAQFTTDKVKKIGVPGKTCDAIEGIIAEAQEIMEEFKGSPALDAGLLAAAQAVEHYEIARYGTLKAWAAQLGLADAERLLDQTLQEETATDQILTGLAETVINAAAQS